VAALVARDQAVSVNRIDRDLISLSLGWSAAGSAVQAILQLVALIVLSRLVEPGDFGLLAVGVAFITIFAEVGRLGVDEAIIQTQELTAELCSALFAIAVLLGLAVTVCVWLAAPVFAWFAGEPDLVTVIRVLSLCIVFSSAGSVGQGLISRRLAFRQLSIIQVISSGLGVMMIGFPLAGLGYGVWALVGMTLAQCALNSAMTLWIGQPRFRFVFPNRAVRTLFAFGSWSTLARILFHLASNVDYLIIGRVLGVSILGFYERAFRVIEVASARITGVVTGVSFPVVSRMTGNTPGKRKAFLSGTSLLASLYLPLSCFISLSAKEIVAVLFGERWMDVSVPLGFLAIGLYFRASAKFLDSLVRGSGSVRALSLRVGLYFVMIAVAASAGVQWGLRGVSLGVASAMIARWVLMCRLCIVLCDSSWTELLLRHRAALVMATVVLSSTVLVQFGCQSMDWDSMPLLTAELVLAGTVALAAFLCTRRWKGWDDLREGAGRLFR
jgi:PST family polysaccharide transporter